ncbi:ABSCISIC ACID-INSENSITIVE 5-like protein 2 [Citrus sinensis]|uniref:BZIP domain-containing protein n=1 Tax=Citrus clementina TaxID=85681 RepID=V4TCE9_CITCL|nr:ABSCISIC ACID-INSENSITIVE 5-like protein 2 [Citrus x clementina]XP_015384102.2 ABSCISIC ACID-INSENSITIVE 5-like protein 2 [Citrus sinensis]ESR47316.1 hypothetical protein CICLE_v10003120mg [Citrus x clementina]KAH9690909.1 ABSCISIC ACID-INSENSITIVE 5-like protein 2 [Citrus sinensis]
MVSPNGGQGPPYNNLIYDHEVRSQMGNIGKPSLMSNHMNLNHELAVIKNVQTVSGDNQDGVQIVQNPSSSSSSSSPPPSYFLGNINLNGRLSKKTIDQVWKDTVHHEHEVDHSNQSAVVQQQLTPGETTLEDFLLRAGIINNSMGNNNNNNNNISNNNNHNGVAGNHHQPLISMGIDPMVVVSQQADWLQFQMASQQQQMGAMDTSYNVSESVYENPVGDIGYSENQLALSMPMPATSAAPSELSKVNNVGRKRRYSDEIMEKTIERKQKRMIKNRESAARSRARKQAYTNQLESQVLWLRKRNSWLKKQKEVDILFSSYPTPMSKYQLRRASSV